MATLLHKSQVQWAAASVLRNTLMDKQQPTLLGFKSDSFMRDFLSILQNNPAQLKGFIVTPELFRTSPLGPPLSWLTPPPGHLKLYLPIHGCFYLVLASLVNTLPGLPPDRLVDVTLQESARFVLRRLLKSGKEMAWITDPTKAAPANKTWQELSTDQYTTSVPNEALLPLFPVKYPDPTAPGQQRRMLAGYIPTMSSETYQPAQSGTQLQPKIDPSGATLYILRCIFFRPKCVNCTQDVVSEPTAPFQIASVYDSDAPTRPSHTPTPPEVLSATLDKLRQLLSSP